MPSEELKKLAEELKETREKAEITLEFIASKTRIDMKFLKAIEEGDFEVMPEVYIRAFIKEYAVQCGLDPDSVLEKYDLAKKGKYVEKKELDSEEKDDNKEDEPKSNETNSKKEFTDVQTPTEVDKPRGNKQQIVLALGAIIVIVIVIAGYFLFIKNSSPDIVVEKPFEEVLQEQNKRFEITEDEKPKEPVKTVDSLALSISATDTCWVNVTIDGNIDKEFMLYRNTSTTVKAATKFDVIVGNVGDISLKLNGEPLALEGNKGQRKTFSVNKDGLINSSN